MDKANEQPSGQQGGGGRERQIRQEEERGAAGEVWLLVLRNGKGPAVSRVRSLPFR